MSIIVASVGLPTSSGTDVNLSGYAGGQEGPKGEVRSSPVGAMFRSLDPSGCNGPWELLIYSD